MPTLEEILQQLPPDLKRDVQVYAESLLRKRTQAVSERRLRQDWGGALRGQRERYTSLELQRQGLAWRDG
ncbi:MAG: DUF2281 domain-containing protein [Dehalococcoidia bacterium]